MHWKRKPKIINVFAESQIDLMGKVIDLQSLSETLSDISVKTDNFQTEYDPNNMCILSIRINHPKATFRISKNGFVHAFFTDPEKIEEAYEKFLKIIIMAFERCDCQLRSCSKKRGDVDERNSRFNKRMA